MNLKLDSYKYRHEIIPVVTLILISKALRPLTLPPVRCVLPRNTLLIKLQSRHWAYTISVTPADLTPSELLKCRVLLHELHLSYCLAKTPSSTINLL